MSSIEMALTLLRQCVVIFLLFGLGFMLRRVGMVDAAAARQMCSLVLMVVTPTVMIDLLQRPFLPEELGAIGAAAVAVVLFYLLLIPLTRLVFRKQPDHSDRIKRLSVMSSNVGFVGVPLISAIMGEHGLLFIAVYIVIFNIHVWTHGITMLRGERKIHWKEIVTCPALVAAAVGMLLYFGNIRLPAVLSETATFLMGLNTPLPTILTGIFIAELPLREIVADRRVYLPCLLRLVVAPLLLIGLLWLIGLPDWAPGAREAALVIAIGAACPAAMNTMLLPGRLGMDATFGSNIIAQSNLFCIITVPAVAMVARAAFQI